jgi:pyruvate dehydrogenase E2 component (dihydrolipoamide acetyltransferase)
MPSEFKIPELGENITSGDVVRVLVKPGDQLAKDQPVLELETDKATIEVPSDVAGTVKDIKVKSGDKVKVGQVVLTVEGAGKAEGADAEGAEAKGADAEGAEKGKGAAASPKAQPAAAAEEGGLSQKASSEPRREEGGAARAEADREEGQAEPPEAQRPDEAPPRQKRGEVVDISRGARPQPAPAPQPAAADQPAAAIAPAAPSVRRMARELGVDIQHVRGSGDGGRITVEDVQEYVKGVMSGAATVSSAVAGSALAPGMPLPDFTKWGEVERKPMSNIRRKTAEHLAHAWNAIPHVTQHDKADITELETLRKQYSPQAERAGGKLTMTAIALKILAGAIRKFPQFNASIDQARNEIVYKKSIHIGVAVDTDRGLLVPVLRDVDRKGIFALSAELAQVSEKARGGKLSLEEMSGGGMSISNLGGIGGTSFTPIVNWPEVAILGISRGAYEPRWDGHAFQPRLMLPLSLSYDHRVIDGADAARFLRWVCDAFEQPFVLAL